MAAQDGIEVTCPLHHVVVTCSPKYWTEHIEDGHPEMVGLQGLVAKAIEEPLAVYQGDVPDRYTFYRPAGLPEPFRGYHVRVAVKYIEKRFRRTRGIVLTAFLVTGPKQQEILVWP